jgi:HSP20 family protein
MAESRGANRPQESSNPQSPVQQRGLSTAQGRELTRSMQAASPFSFMRRFMSDMDRLFEDFGFGGAPTSTQGRSGDPSLWSPQADVTTRDGQLLIHVDLPGLKQDEVKVMVEEGILSISGERNDQHEENRGGVYRRERSYGSFRRELALPEGVDPESIQASFENGVLQVSMPMPKDATPKGRTIPILPKPPGGPDVH